MEVWKKITVGTLAGGVIIGGIIFIPKLIKLKNASPELDVIPTAKIHKLDFTGITIRIDVQLKNPTTAAFKMKYPYIRLSYKGSVIGTSQSVNKDIEMPGFGEANISQIMMHVPITSVLSMAGALLKAVQNNTEVKVDITTLTHIDPYWEYDEDKKEWKRLINLGKKSLIPYTKAQAVTLRKQK
jgi:hypothetical protein